MLGIIEAKWDSNRWIELIAGPECKALHDLVWLPNSPLLGSDGYVFQPKLLIPWDTIYQRQDNLIKN